VQFEYKSDRRQRASQNRSDFQGVCQSDKNGCAARHNGCEFAKHEGESLTKMEQRFFKEIIIWQEVSEDTIARYRIFEILPDSKFFVKNKDFFYYPVEQEHLKSIEFYSIDSLFQGSLHMEEEFCNSIEEAITKHQKDFA
jgi:hypothetical protein